VTVALGQGVPCLYNVVTGVVLGVALLGVVKVLGVFIFFFCCSLFGRFEKK
jgi:hypothetical protein